MVEKVNQSDRVNTLEQKTERPLAIEMEGITKVYGKNRANDNIDFNVCEGEIHALLGENGAGKSTLMSVLYGLTTPDSGAIRVNSKPATINTPHDAIKRGIGMVHQNFMLVPTFTVAQNVVLGTQRRKFFRRDRDAAAEVEKYSQQFGIEVDPNALTGDLPVDMMQRVEILKLLYRGATTLILDEPTSVLGPVESAALFKTLEKLRSEGASIVIVTHKLAEVMAFADRVTVLRAGTKVLTQSRGEYDAESLAKAMVPHESKSLPPRDGSAEAAGVRLRVRDLTVKNETGAVGLNGLTVDVHGGEVLGVAGVAGNGQQEFLRALSGILPTSSGHVWIDDVQVDEFDTRGRRKVGLGVIPDDREGWAIAPTMTIAENLALTRVGTSELAGRVLIDWKEQRKTVKQLIEDYEVRPADPDIAIGSLSGGNKQKVVLARELERSPGVILAANATQGLDIGAAALVHRKLLEARNEGAAVVIISGDLDEIFKVTDRLIVLYKGQIAYECQTSEADYNQVARAMAGVEIGEVAS